jgi:hypothetical protein
LWTYMEFYHVSWKYISYFTETKKMFSKTIKGTCGLNSNVYGPWCIHNSFLRVVKVIVLRIEIFTNFVWAIFPLYKKRARLKKNISEYSLRASNIKTFRTDTFGTFVKSVHVKSLTDQHWFLSRIFSAISVKLRISTNNFSFTWYLWVFIFREATEIAWYVSSSRTLSQHFF